MDSKVGQLVAYDFKCEVHLSFLFNWNTFSKIIIVLNKTMYLGFVESNLFINCLHFLFNPPIPHWIHILYLACILL
jgi:hypothetical protein